MSLSRGRFSVALAVAAIAIACGGPPPVRTPDGTLAIVPTVPVTTKPADPVAPKRPDSVVAWLHVDDPDALIDLLGGTGQPQHLWPHELLGYLELVDLRQPIDGVLVALGGKHDVEPVVRLHFRDSKTLFERLGKELKVREDGDRVHLRDKHGGHEDEGDEGKGDDLFVCDFTGTGRDSAICGTTKGVDAVVDWLRTGPLPREDESTQAMKGSSIARFVGYGAAARKVFAKELENDHGSDSELRAVLTDARTLSLNLVRDGARLGFSASLRLESTRADFTRDLVEAPNGGGGIPEPFQRIWQDTSAAVFVPGGGAVPKWMTELVASSEPTYGVGDAQKERVHTAAKALGDAFKKPAALGYGVRIDKAKTALTAVRATTKDQDKALRALQEALEPQLMYALAMDAPAAEKVMRELAAAWTAVGQEHERQSAGSGTPYPHPKFAVRAAPAKWGLPKGSFFFDETKADWANAASTPGGGATPKTKTEYTLHVPQGANVWGITCTDEKLCVESAKKIISGPAPAKRETDEMFERKGIVCAGYLTSLVGALSMHHYTLASSSGGALNDALAEIERDLNAPRMVLPFVLTTQKAGDGGTLAFEIRGERDAFRVIGEHIGISASSIIGIVMMLGLGR